jgi:hypothetical protein
VKGQTGKAALAPILRAGKAADGVDCDKCTNGRGRQTLKMSREVVPTVANSIYALGS